MSDAVLKAENIIYKYGVNAALKGVSFDVAKGEIFGLIGPDGAGKTTLIRIFCGLLAPFSGKCEVLGLDTVKQKDTLIKKIGYLSQKFSLYGDLSVSENINFFAEIHGLSNYGKKKEELLEFTDLGKFRKRLANNLSGGMKQKLALACTLIHTPDIIFLDEPTNGVDPVARRDFWDILGTVSSQGLSIIISTPYIDEAERCHRLAFMDEGSVIAYDTPKALKAAFRKDLLEVVCEPVRMAAANSRNIPGVSSVQLFGDKIHIAYDGNTTDENKITHALSGGVSVSGIRRIRPSLEDIFINLLERKTTEGQDVSNNS